MSYCKHRRLFTSALLAAHWMASVQAQGKLLARSTFA